VYADKTLTCADCGASFIFSADDQAFHAEKGFTNEPKRCPDCRASRRAERGNSGGGGYGSYSSGPREMFTATCAQCGKEAQVPFQPRGDKPVYCSDCFRSQRSSSGGYGGSRGGSGGGYGGGRGGGGGRW
jgi:CxxC-x17-CxxC domain-containing protein